MVFRMSNMYIEGVGLSEYENLAEWIKVVHDNFKKSCQISIRSQVKCITLKNMIYLKLMAHFTVVAI